MSQRELLQQCLKALEEQDYPWHEELIKGIRAELEKPEPAECGVLEVLKELLFSWETRFDHHEELELYQRVRAEIYRAEGREGWTEEDEQ